MERGGDGRRMKEEEEERRQENRLIYNFQCTVTGVDWDGKPARAIF